MYIVKRGKLQVCGEDDGRGNVPVFATLAEGAVFGELSILNIAGERSYSFQNMFRQQEREPKIGQRKICRVYRFVRFEQKRSAQRFERISRGEENASGQSKISNFFGDCCREEKF